MSATLEAVGRSGRGKNEARRLRSRGRIPAVLYGGGGNASNETVSIEVDPRALMRILHSEAGYNSLIALTLDGTETRVMVRECQLDPVTHRPLHADFYRVRMDRRVHVFVPIVLKGEARGVKQQGGLLDFVHREIEVECLPADIPEHVGVDVTELLVGQSLRVRDLTVDPRWTAVSEPDLMLVHVIMPKAEEAPPAAEAAAPAAPAEPEVIKKGKAEKAEEEEE
jgi:large subunit ribosomal protein L25